MNDPWTITADGRFLVRNHFAGPRFLIGLPFLLTGLWFFIQYFVLGLAEFISAGDIPGIFKDFFGWIVILIMSAVFLVPGWILCFVRRGVLIDPKSDRIIAISHFGVWRSHKQFSLASYDRLVLLAEPIKGSRSSQWSHTLHFADKTDHLVPIDSDTNEAAMKKLGNALAKFLGRELKSFTQHEWSEK